MLTVPAFLSLTTLIFPYLVVVSAHGFVNQVTIDGKAYKGNAPQAKPFKSGIRQISQINPINEPTAKSVSCGWDAKVAALNLDAMPGSNLTFRWIAGPTNAKHWPHDTGPLLTYMASCGSNPCSEFDSSKAKWFKIDQLGKQKNGSWHQEMLIFRHPAKATIPRTLASGNYLIRHEIIALHNTPIGIVEFYPSCTQLRVGGNETGAPEESELVSFPGAYKYADPGILDKNVYEPGDVYKFPGPPIAKFVHDMFSGTSSSNTSTSASSLGSQVSGPESTFDVPSAIISPSPSALLSSTSSFGLPSSSTADATSSSASQSSSYSSVASSTATPSPPLSTSSGLASSSVPCTLIPEVATISPSTFPPNSQSPNLESSSVFPPSNTSAFSLTFTVTSSTSGFGSAPSPTSFTAVGSSSTSSAIPESSSCFASSTMVASAEEMASSSYRSSPTLYSDSTSVSVTLSAGTPPPTSGAPPSSSLVEQSSSLSPSSSSELSFHSVPSIYITSTPSSTSNSSPDSSASQACYCTKDQPIRRRQPSRDAGKRNLGMYKYMKNRWVRRRRGLNP